MIRAAVSVIIPARNEVALIRSTVESVLRARDVYGAKVEIIVVDNESDDGTGEAVADIDRIRVVRCEPRGAAHARNLGVGLSGGDLLVFLDADTHLPPGAIERFADLCRSGRYEAGIVRLGSLDGGLRGRCWWAFWNLVRHLPIARAKAMPACMFCTRAVFDEFGPFDVAVAIGEEWPILAGLYRNRRHRLLYDRTLTALSSCRRMELQRFGYSRTFARYVWAILSARGRVGYPDHIRHRGGPVSTQGGR